METNMVQMGLPVGNSSVPDSVLPGAGKTEGTLAKEADHSIPQSTKAPVKEQVTFDPTKTEQTRLENMQQGTRAMFKEVYAVSDTKFSIYKNSTGDFVTKFTNLRDGKVSYIPEPDMMQYMESRGKARKALLKIDV